MHTGSCLCGGIKYSVDDPLEFAVNCYCEFCRKAHGSTFVTLAFAPLDKLKIRSGEELLSKYELANVDAYRCFCSKCGTRLFNLASGVGMVSLVTATLDRYLELAPLANINIESLAEEAVPKNDLPNYDSAPNAVQLQELLENRKYNQ